MIIKKPILTFLFLNAEFLFSDISLFRHSLLLYSRNLTSCGLFWQYPAPLRFSCVSVERVRNTLRAWLKPNLACSDHLRLYGLVCYDLRNSSKFTSDGKVMKDGSEKNSAVNLKIALILSYNWHGEIGIVKMSIL